MMTESELQDFLDEQVSRWWAIIRRHYPQIQKCPPACTLNRRLKTTLARAWVENNPQKIDVSVSLGLQYPALYASDVVPHELCHLVAFTVYKDTGHGKAWKQMMRDLGLSPNLRYTV